MRKTTGKKMKQLPLTGFCSINMGQSPDSKSYNSDQKGLPFFQGNADFGPVCPNVRVWCSEPIKIAEPGDILISVRAPIGAMNMANTRCCIGRGLASLTPNGKKCVPQYLYYALQSRVDFLISQGTGSTFKAISKKVLSDALIPDYPLDEQRKIAAALDKIDSLTAKRRRQLEKLDELVKSRFVEMFGDPEFNTKHLPVVCLSDVCEVGSSKRIYQSEQSMTGIPFLRISDLVTLMDTGELKADLYIPEIRYRELKIQRLVPNPGDILITSRGTLGRCYIVRDTDDFYFQDGMISWLSKFSGEVVPLYIEYLFAMNSFRKQIDGLQAGSTVAYLSIAMLKKLKIMVPPLALQQQFASFVQATDKSKLAVQQSLATLETLKKSLMQNWFA